MQPITDDPWTTLPATSRTAVEAAALLGPCDAEALAAVLEQPIEDVLLALVGAGLIQAEGAQLRLDPLLDTAAQAALDAVPQRCRMLLRNAQRHYAARLAGQHDAGTEERYLDHLARYCELLIRQEPCELAGELDHVPLALLQRPAHRQLVQYYQALGVGLCDRYDAARSQFNQLLTEPDLDDVVRARALNSGAIFAQVQGDYEHARDAFAQASVIWQRLGNGLRQALTLHNLGLLQYDLHEYAQAETSFRQGAALFEQSGDGHHQALAYNALGQLYRDQGGWAEALDYLGRAAAIFEREHAHDSLGRVANNLGETELLQGHFATARAHFEHARGLMTTRVHAVDVSLNLGLIAQAEGDDSAAINHYHAALDLAVQLERHDVLALIHYRTGHAQQRLGQLDAAQASYAAAIETIETTRAPIGDEGLLISLMGRWQEVYEAAVQLCLARGDIAGAFAYTERARARAFADLLLRHDTGLAHTEPTTAVAVQRALPADQLVLAYFCTGLHGAEGALLRALPATAAGLRACLTRPPQVLLFALTATTLQAVVCSVDPQALEARPPWGNDGQRFLLGPTLRRLDRALWTPIASLAAQAKEIVIVPHGPLHHLPFAALLDATDQPLLHSAPALRYTPSATLLLHATPPRPPALEKCLALSYPGLDGRLRHTEAEARTIARLCDGVAWVGTTGIVQRLRDEVSRYRWLHLACHGESNHDDPLRSWLEVGPDECLVAADIIRDWTLHAELVVLSACRSGVSRVLRGDEPMGLVRAFLAVGVRAVLVTLWPVEDTSARLLMEHFYATLLAQAQPDPAQALRQAQYYLRNLSVEELRTTHTDLAASVGNHTPQPFADPRFWAAYVVIGG